MHKMTSQEVEEFQVKLTNCSQGHSHCNDTCDLAKDDINGERSQECLAKKQSSIEASEKSSSGNITSTDDTSMSHTRDVNDDVVKLSSTNTSGDHFTTNCCNSALKNVTDGMLTSSSVKGAIITSLASECKLSSSLTMCTSRSQQIEMSSSTATATATATVAVTNPINVTQITFHSIGAPSVTQRTKPVQERPATVDSAYTNQLSNGKRPLQVTVDTSVLSKEEFTFGIEILDVTHTYDNEENILNGITMKVEHGSIYGLLGASGCGKTTLLKCLIGMMRPTSGSIDVFGRKPLEANSGIPGRLVGYMPQEIALYSDLTIEETLLYFGRLYFMEEEKMKQQIKYLIEMLDLPNKRRMVSTLSGGQMRRVSFAAALIHEPPLVILDEPTAGVDPILRSSIWKYLVDLSKKSNITIIITTHYIEEAKSADRVGLMRSGQLLAEDSPTNLLSRFNCNTLEDVFLALCTKCEEEHLTAVRENALRQQQRCNQRLAQYENTSTHQVDAIKKRSTVCVKRTNVNGSRDKNNMVTQVSTNHPPSSDERRAHFQQFQSNRSTSIRGNDCKSTIEMYRRQTVSWMSQFNTLMWKNYIRSIRHPLLIVFQYVLPAIQIILFGICIGGDPFDIKVGIVNDEQPPYLSELFLEHIDTYFINGLPYANTSDARRDVETNKIWGYIHFNSNFSDALIARLNAHDWGDPDNATIDQSRLLIHADLTDKLISVTMERSLEESYQQFAKALFKEFNIQPELATFPVVAADPIYGTYKHESHKGYREFMAPGILLSIAFSMAYAITCLVLILEREEKTFERNFVTGVTSSQIIIAHTLIRMIFMFGQGFVLLFLTIYLFSIPSRGPLLGALILLMSQNLAGISYGMLLSAIFKKTHEASTIAIGTIFFIILTSGVIWSVEAIPMWLRWFSYIQPCTIPNAALRSVLSRGFDFTQIAYWKGVGVSLVWTVILFTVSIKNYTYT